VIYVTFSKFLIKLKKLNSLASQKKNFPISRTNPA